MGFKWTPIFRVGGSTTYALNTLLTYAGGPTKTELNYELVLRQRTTPLGKQINLFVGWRPVVAFTFAIGDTMSDHSTIITIVNALTAGSTVELTLNNGTTYRRVEIRRYNGPNPFNGKNFAGAEFTLEVACTDLIPTLTAIGSGNW